MAGYIGPIPVPQATQNRETFTATASQTSFATGGYQAGYLDVFMNGVKLVDGSDYTATNGSDVVLATGAAVNDIIEVVSYSAFEVLNQNFTGTTVVDDLTVGGDLTVTGTTITLDHASAQTVDLGDNDKIRLGDGDDLQIYHDGSGSFIDDAGTGPLKIRTDNFVGIYNGDETETIATFADDGAVRLYFDNVERLTTTSTGIDVSGKFKTSSTGDAFNTTTSSHASGYAMDHYENSNDANNAWGAGRWHDGRYVISQKPSSATWASDATQRLVIDTSGNIGIGDSSPSRALSTKSASVTVGSFESTSASGGLISFVDPNTTNDVTVRIGSLGNNLVLQAGGSERMRIDGNGHISKPWQPAFAARAASAQNDLAENTKLIFETQLFDQNADYDTSTSQFTAPITGRYVFNVNLRIDNIDTASNWCRAELHTSNRVFQFAIMDPSVLASDPTYWNFCFSLICHMDAADTAEVRWGQSGGSIQARLSATESMFSGYLEV